MQLKIKKSSIRVLVCSGNLGNAEPDAKSLAAWVPDDGDCKSVLENQKYPLKMDNDLNQKKKSDKKRAKDLKEGDNDVETESEEEEDDDDETEEETGEEEDPNVTAEGHFDLIVLGLQESTFIPKGSTKEDLEMEDDSVRDGSSLNGFSDHGGINNSKEMSSSDHGMSNSSFHHHHNNNSMTIIQEEAPLKDTTQSSSSQPEDGPIIPILEEDPSPRTSLSAQTKFNQRVKKASEFMASQTGKATEFAKDVIGDVKQQTKDMLVANSTSALHQKLKDRLPSYTRLLSFQRGEMRLLIFARTHSNTDIQVKSCRAQNTGKAGLPNKGGIVAVVQVDDSTTMAFGTAHLEAHEGLQKYKTRCSTIADIFKGTTKSPHPDASLSSHYCFFMGDLNFRTRYKGHVSVKEQGDDVRQLVQDENWHEINQADELRKALHNHECLFGFTTPPCHFPPTFKVERDQVGYKYQPKRTPSYTDRILWRTGNLLHPRKNLTPLCYEPIDAFTSSDHKPIRGAFAIQLNEHCCALPPEKCSNQRSSLFRQMAWKASAKETHDSYNMAAANASKSEKLHIYLSDIQCDIFPKSKSSKTNNNSEGTSSNNNNSNSNMDSYVSVVSSPASLLKPPKQSSWRKVMRSFKMSLKKSQSSQLLPRQLEQQQQLRQFEQEETLARWPHTDTIKNTLNPDWGEEEIHCKLQRHDPRTGQPNNVGGAILHIFARQAPDGQVIGSFPVNLEYLFRLCHADTSDDWRESIEELLTSSTSSNSGITMHDPSMANSRMVSWDIDGPLLKDGRQTGVIRCSLDAWWTHDGLAHAAKAKSIAMGLASNDQQVTRAMERSSRQKHKWWSSFRVNNKR